MYIDETSLKDLSYKDHVLQTWKFNQAALGFELPPRGKILCPMQTLDL